MKKNRVVASYNDHGTMRCVDVFHRPDGSYGFEEYRRDIEDGRGWFAVGGYAQHPFVSPVDALAAAKQRVAWLPPDASLP